MERLNQIKKLTRKRWLTMTVYIVAIAGASVGFALLLEYVMVRFDVSIEGMASAAYLLVFGITLASNAAVLAPVTYPHLAIMIAATKYWDPFLIALVASVAGTLGEITGYYAGYLGKRIAHLENTPGYERLAGWMKKYSFWGIFIISLQPILPVDIAGLLAGASKLPLWKFLLPCWAGKLAKYVAACYIGERVLHLFPPLPF